MVKQKQHTGLAGQTSAPGKLYRPQSALALGSAPATLGPHSPASCTTRARKAPNRPTTRERLEQVLDLLRRQQQLLKAVLKKTPALNCQQKQEEVVAAAQDAPKSHKMKRVKSIATWKALCDAAESPTRKRNKKNKGSSPDQCFL